MEGKIITRGTKALTIQTESMQQFYALFENIDKNIIEILGKISLDIPVKFEINKKRYEGETIYGKRYHAYNVKLVDSLYFKN